MRHYRQLRRADASPAALGIIQRRVEGAPPARLPGRGHRFARMRSTHDEKSLLTSSLLDLPVYLTIVCADMHRYRFLQERLPLPPERRIVVITGARQVGKTTLVRHTYPQLPYFTLDVIEDREALANSPMFRPDLL